MPFELLWDVELFMWGLVELNVILQYVEIKCQLDATDEFLLQILFYKSST
jgi:hypothetical protein